MSPRPTLGAWPRAAATPLAHALSLSTLLALSGCACPPPPAADPGGAAPHAHAHHDAGSHGSSEQPGGEHGHGPHGAHGHPATRPHGGEPGAHGAHGGPLVHRFTEGGEHWQTRFEGPDRDASQKPAVVIEKLQLTAGMTVADIGAGTGYFMEHLVGAVGSSGRVLSIDIEPSMVRHLKARANKAGFDNVEARLALTDDPLLADGSVARILVVNTWHHIPERESYGKKLFRALSPGGEVFVIDFNMQTSRGPKKEHRLKPELVLAELEAAGFETRLDATSLPDQYIAIGHRPG